MSINLLILISFLIIVSVWDMRTFEIPSTFILIGSILGFGLSYWENGFSGLASSFYSLLIMFFITFSIWAIGEMIFGASIIGGGDMKLFMVISIFLGVHTTMQVFYWSILLAGFLFIFMIHPKEILGLFRNIFMFFVYAIPKSKTPTKKLAFSIPITLATILLIIL